MTLTRHMKSFALVIFFLVLHCNLSFSRHHGIRHGRHKRNHGAHLYLTASSIIPGGEGGPSDRWVEWGAPSECSRSCGGGVSYQTRECHNVDADGRPKCRGGSKKYFSCNTQDCPEDEIDFRQQQCSHFDQQPFEGLRYEWVPYTKAPNPCELNCMPRGERFYYRHKLKVIDGTRCNDESLDVCVDGTCQPVGCDMMIGSNSTEDKCRKCSGDGSTCKTESGLLDTNYLLVGYNDILLIPAGATNIEIKEVSPSNNYLAIRNKTGNYYLNGNWRIDFPRTMWFAGCYWHYERKPQGFAAPDHLKCLGPTSEPIFLVLLQQDRNVGIKYEYFIPEAEHLSEPDTYSWTFTQYGACSVSCGGGFQTRNVTCNKMQSLEQVESSLCEIKTKPSDTQQCNQESCPPQWNEGDWSKCSAPCGNNGTQEREVHCERIDAHGKSSQIADAVCTSEIGKKPTTIQECNTDLVCPEWYLGPWLPCNKLCDDGVQKRTVKCYRKENNEITILEDDECSEQKPETTKPCMLRPCEGIDWITTAWSGCKACGQTKETRTAYCGTKQGKIYGNNLCDAAKKPDRVRECSGPPCEFQWYTSQWSKCSSQCNDGVQTRNVVCGAFDGTEIHKASDESKCDVALKPNTTRDCVPKEDECVGEWFAGPWNACSKECGGGNRNRTVICLVNGTSVKPTLCNQADILFTMGDCNTQKCSDDDILPIKAADKTSPDSSSEEDDEEYDEMVDCEDDDILKVIPTESVDFDRTETTYATESTLRDDELMLSDATGFELAPKSTSIPLSTVEGSGDDDEGSGDDGKSTSIDLDITTDIEGSAESSLVTEEAVSKVQSTLFGSSISSDADDSTTEGGTTELDGLSTTTDSGLTTSESGSSVSDLFSTTEGGSSLTTDSVSSSESGSTTTASGLSTDGSDTTAESEASSTVSSSTEGGSTGSTDDSSTTAGSSTDSSSTTEAKSTDDSSTTEGKSTDDSSTTEGSSTEGSSTTEAGSTDGISTTVDSGTGTTETDFPEITEPTIIPKGLDTQKDVKPTEGTTDDLSTEASGSSETSDSGTTTTPSGLSSTSESGSSSSVESSISTELVSSTTAGSSLSTESGSSTTAGSSLSTESGSSLSTSDETTETATTGSSTSGATPDSTSDQTSDTTSDQTSDTTSDQTSDTTSDQTTDSTSEVTTDSTQSSESTPTPDSSSTSDATTPTTSSDETTLSTDGATGTTDSTPSSTPTSDGSTLSTDDVSSTTDTATTSGASTSDDDASSISTDAKSTDVDGSSTTDSSISTTTDSGLSTETTLDLLTETGETSTIDGSSTTKDGSTTETSDESSTSDKSTEISSVGSSDGSSTTTDGSTTDDGSTTVGDTSTTDGGSTTETTLDGSSLKSTDSDGTTASSGLSDLTTEGSSDSTTQGSTDVSSDGSTTEGVSTTTDGTTGSTDDATTASPLSTEFESTVSTVEGSGSTTDDDSTISTVLISTVDSSKSTDFEGSTQSTTEGSSISTDVEGSTQSTSEGSSISTDIEGSTQSTTEGSTISTDIDGSTQSTTEGSSISTDIEGSTQSTIEGSTVSTIEDTTIDIWTTTGSSSDTTKYDDQTTPNTLITAIELEGSSKRPKLCKRKKKAKKPSCNKAEFGCCPDGKTKAKGPFDEGCNVPKTCNETTHGCCPDGLSPATGKNNEGCPPSMCNQTLFGCCPDDYTTAEGADFEGCPIETTTTDMPTETTDTSTTEQSTGSSDLTDTTATGETTESSLSTVSTDELSTESTIALPAAMHCAQSTYGCCPDGISEATGENFHGCDIIDKDNCTNSYYGCCDDGQTAALGANGDGCASCIHAQFGCCPDNQHPAHGPHKEGCCLNSQFGCCPDNILEAQGPQLEGCGCQYSSYGCCPDNVTSALGYENDGCGCEFAPHGCCSDQLTAAKGPNFAGCPCHTSQFGCCPDGITIPQGPHGYGCHCTHSTFKCCGDEVTPAQGPDAQGCTCANSEFGCCPDGVTDAKGTNFEQCQNVPESPQVSCALPSERGECSNYTVKYYFDANYGGCSRFWYGGCGGNGNKFDSQDDCEEVCVKPENKAVCDLPQVKGACDGYFPMYYYDTESKTCSQFIYGGCLGNNNRFQTREECLQLCSIDESISTCEQPVAEGPCNGTFERWYFDKDTEVCQPFNYGGCKGNKNNFATKHACLYNCKKPGVLRDTCKLDKHEGECSDTEARWYFSESDNKCMPFYFTGCGGNKNNYETFEDCEQSCPKQIDLDLCHFPAEIGDCQNYTTKWYFDTRESNCRQFYYGGCGGNKNNFDDEDACLNQCSPQPTTPPHIPIEPFNIGHCSLPDDVGPGKRYENRWAYHPEDGLCHQFVYGGYGGNQNNFESSNECEAKCADSQDPCQLPAIQGSCDENITRWYFDDRAGSCLEFLYSGCGSNRNNFYTEDRCEARCGRKEPETGEQQEHHSTPVHDVLDLDTTVPLESSGELDEYHTTKMVVDIDDRTDSSGDDYCNAPLDYGDDSCDDARESIAYYYNSAVQRCEAFVYIGCGGNGNRFDTESQCVRQCGVSKGQDVCSEPNDLGPCDEWVIKYFYNTETKSCNQFYYGGCGGNGNRFDSNAECESICIAREEPISNKAICLLRPSYGECNTTEDFSSKRYYYDDSRGTCMVFIYSGCAGNQNNFKTLKSCHDFCSDGTQAPEVHHTSPPAPPLVEPVLVEVQETVEAAEHPCQSEQEQCNQLNCPYGISKEYNEHGCEICACDDPCQNHVCPEDSRCSVDFVPDDQQTHDSPIFIAVCRQVRKPGECPVLSNSTRCERECYEDSDCRGDKKCCVAGCGFNCVPPVEERAPTTAGPETPSPYLVIPGGVASVLETKPEAEVNVNVTEGGVATLRCFATGYPYPTIQWQKGGLTINTAVGRYHLTSTGDLQIVQLHKTDSGSYVCVADNGLGPPVRRVVELSVDRQTTIPAYIIGDKNSTQIITLNQPATLRCLAGGVPNVYISWWKGKNLIPYTDTISQRFEITKDYSLVFKRVELSDLGTYLCEAYSGLGKPVSIQVTLKAIGPVHISKPEDEMYRQYLVAVPEAPKPSYPYRPTQVSPPRLPPQEDRQKMPRILATAHIRFPNGTQFEPNRPVVLECIVTGSPKVAVRWYKDEQELDPSRHIRIIEIDEEGSSRLTISNSTKDDTGYYKCEAVNSHSKAYHTEYLVVEGVYVPASCTDNQFFANCGLIVEGNYCNHKYYSKFCCRSCTLAGQLSWSHPNNI